MSVVGILVSRQETTNPKSILFMTVILCIWLSVTLLGLGVDVCGHVVFVFALMVSILPQSLELEVSQLGPQL